MMATETMSGAKAGAQITKTDLIDSLNSDLAGEFQAIIQYVQYAACVTGYDRPQLSAFFRSEIPDELGHAQFLAEKIAALGGTPTTEPRPVKHARNSREMLEAVLEAERQAIADYRERAEQAEQLGEIGLKVQLENMEEVQKLLAS